MAGRQDNAQPHGSFRAVERRDSVYLDHDGVTERHGRNLHPQANVIASDRPDVGAIQYRKTKTNGPRHIALAPLVALGGIPMLRLFSFLLASLLGLVATGSIAVSLASQSQPASDTVSVNRTLKGDRLPVARPARVGTHDVSNERPALPKNSKRDAPVGCDPLFSPISTPALAHLYRRCLT